MGAQMKIKLLVGLVAGLFALVGVSPAWADPATLHIGPGVGTPCAMGCAGDPNLIGGSVVDIFQNSGGAPSLFQPVLLIIGVPNDTTNLFASVPISAVSFINGGTTTAGSAAFATGGTFGLKSPTAGGFFGSMTSSYVYNFLTLTGPTNASNSFTNWSGADSTILGITANNFGIYVFALSGAALGPNGFVNITFSSSLPIGTFAVGYGQGIQNEKLKGYSTPFTEAGLVVPEPGTLALFGTGLLTLAGLIRRRMAG